MLSAFSRLNRETTQPSNVRKNRPPRRRRRGRGRPPESPTGPLQQSAPPQPLCPPQPRNLSPPCRDSGHRVLPLESTPYTVTGVPTPNTTIQGRAWPATSLTTSSLHSYEATTRSTAATTDDLSQDGDSDLSALVHHSHSPRESAAMRQHREKHYIYRAPTYISRNLLKFFKFQFFFYKYFQLFRVIFGI